MSIVLNRNRNLDFLKGLMIILVIITHSSFAVSHRDNSPFFSIVVDMAVPVFMIISGFVNTASGEKWNGKVFYDKDRLLKKLLRIALPFLPIAIIMTVYRIVRGNDSLISIIYSIVFQRWGPGGYYPVMMIQFIILFPLLYRVSMTKAGCTIVLLVNIISEYVFSSGRNMTGIIGTVIIGIHRIIIFRYLGFIVAGILLYRCKDKLNILWCVVFSTFGLICVLALNYLFPDKIFSLWRTTSLPVVFWALSWVIALLLFPVPKEKINHIYKIIETIGKSSYHIMLTQMVYYHLIGDGWFVEPNLIISIILCCTIGVGFQIIDSRNQNKLSRIET